MNDTHVPLAYTVVLYIHCYNGQCVTRVFYDKKVQVGKDQEKAQSEKEKNPFISVILTTVSIHMAYCVGALTARLIVYVYATIR